ncbi:hypothetical protein LTR36_000376 [Oleoguttula mirabilis]|uniref:Uncharacterized protein n=1 Tax=Oleoguttula mirabilis TaxID=1507867 RepID=A0AAV9JYY0_9PEZI|nr:hypothetical protein LTR36_000376 [Oleoguttula mirabilis]
MAHDNIRKMLPKYSEEWGDDDFRTGEAEARSMAWDVEQNQQQFLAEFTEREHKLAQFCNAYSDVSFVTISAAVPVVPEVAELAHEDGAGVDVTHPQQTGLELTSLIERGFLEHKMDAVDMKLVTNKQDAWVVIRSKALVAAAEVERDLMLRLHGINVVLAGLVVKR